MFGVERARPVRPKPEGQGGGEVLEEVAASPFPTSNGICGSTVSSPSEVRDKALPKTILADFQACRRHLLEAIFVTRTVLV